MWLLIYIQYFLWYLVFLPLYLPYSSLVKQPLFGITVAALWAGAQVSYTLLCRD